MKIVFLDQETLGGVCLEAFNAFGEVMTYARTTPTECVERIRDAEIVVTNKVVMSREVLAEASALKLILVAATGINNIDLDAVREQGIAVANVAGYSTESVVSHTFALYFHLAHHTAYYDAFGKEQWASSGLFTHLGRSFDELDGKKWGIIGMGTIGKRVAAVATAFGAQVSYVSTSGKNRDAGYPCVALKTLLQESDVISIHAPLNEATNGLIGEEELGWMKDSGVLLNLGRGGIVDEAALADALKLGRIGGAGLDVLAPEPPKEDNPLLSYTGERLVLTPHIAWAGASARERLTSEMIENLRAFLDGNARNRVD